jgi:hypothetical protein
MAFIDSLYTLSLLCILPAKRRASNKSGAIFLNPVYNLDQKSLGVSSFAPTYTPFCF